MIGTKVLYAEFLVIHLSDLFIEVILLDSSWSISWRILHECSCINKFIKPVGEEINCKDYFAFYLFFTTILINSIIQMLDSIYKSYNI